MKEVEVTGEVVVSTASVDLPEITTARKRVSQIICTVKTQLIAELFGFLDCGSSRQGVSFRVYKFSSLVNILPKSFKKRRAG